MLCWGTDYFDPNTNAQTFCTNPDNSDTQAEDPRVAQPFVGQGPDRMVAAPTTELDPAKRVAMYQQMQRVQERAPS